MLVEEREHLGVAASNSYENDIYKRLTKDNRVVEMMTKPLRSRDISRSAKLRVCRTVTKRNILIYALNNVNN